MADLTQECAKGYAGGAPNPYYWSSDSWVAFEAGAALSQSGRTAPVKCRKSKGYSVRIETAGDTIILFKFGGKDLTLPKLERL